MPSPSSQAASATEKKSRFSRKKNTSGEPGRVAQMKQLFTMSRAQNPSIPWWMALAFVVGFGILLIIGLLLHHPIVFGFFGVLIGILLAMIVFGRLAEKAAYGQLEGQPGASAAALSALRRGWYFDKEPVAAEANRARSVNDLASAAMVFRAVGRPGVVLVGEGPATSTRKLLESEKKRVARVAGPEVPVYLLRVGQGTDTVPVADLTKRLNKMDKKLTDAEVAAVNKRLRALGAAKPPIPKGMDPRNAPRMDRRAARGR